MKVYIVTEAQLDYDDYPIGAGRTLLVTASKERADFLHSEFGQWGDWMDGRRHMQRLIREMEVEDMPVTDYDNATYEIGQRLCVRQPSLSQSYNVLRNAGLIRNDAEVRAFDAWERPHPIEAARDEFPYHNRHSADQYRAMCAEIDRLRSKRADMTDAELYAAVDEVDRLRAEVATLRADAYGGEP